MQRMLVGVASRIAVTAFVLGGMSGCLFDDRQRVVGYGVSEAVRTLVVQGDTGDIRIKGGGSAVRVTEYRTYRDAEPAATHTTVDGTLTLAYTCPDGHCGVGYEVEVPAGTVVRVANGTGAVTLTGLNAEVEARIGTGSVTARGLGSPTARLETETGDVSVSFAGQPSAVQALSQTGSVRVEVPHGTPYAVDAKTRTGDVKVTLARQDAADHRITARTETGSVTVTGV
jgi:hypothetical protein